MRLRCPRRCLLRLVAILGGERVALCALCQRSAARIQRDNVRSVRALGGHNGLAGLAAVMAREALASAVHTASTGALRLLPATPLCSLGGSVPRTLVCLQLPRVRLPHAPRAPSFSAAMGRCL